MIMAPRSIPALLEQIGNLLDLKGENAFKVRAYQNAARAVAEVDDLDEVIRTGRVREIKGIRDAIAKKLEEYVTTGTMTYYEELTKEVPVGLLELLEIPNLGPRKIKQLHDDLGITNVGELEYAAKENRLASLFGFGARTQEKILKGIEFVKKHKGEFLYAEVYPVALAIKESFHKIIEPEQVSLCGSIRRRKEIVRDIDILVAGEKVDELSAHFRSLPAVEDVIAEGETKTSVRLYQGIEADLRVVDAQSYPFALIYFTGSKEHNVKLRGIAKKRDLKLNEYGLFSDSRSEPLRSEAEVYEALGLPFIPPELREDMGEIEAGQLRALPQLISTADVRGTFHVHTEMSDGVDSLDALVEAAKKRGLSYLGIADHSRSAYYAGGLKGDAIRKQWDEIAVFNSEHPDFCLFKGIESDILLDGSLDYDDELLKGFDFVIASVHSSFNLSQADMEKRIIRAMKHPCTTMLGHPTGRLLLARDGYRIDMRNIIEAAAAHHVILELNASPYRLDIDWRYLRMAKEHGVMIAINPDAHSASGLDDMYYGVNIARKGWQEKSDILNTRTAEEVKKIFGEMRHEKGC